MAKKQPPKTCSWCGTKLAHGSCPRGMQCAIDQHQDELLRERIKAEDAERRKR